jgi:protein TonB
METKKNPRYDLDRKRFAFFQIGLLTAGTLTLAAFAYQSPLEKRILQKNVHRELITFDLIAQEIDEPTEPDMLISPPLEPPQGPLSVEDTEIPTDQITVVMKSTKEPTTHVHVATGGLPTGLTSSTGLIEISSNEIFDIAPVDAEYIGGYEALKSYILKNLHYPQEAIELGEQGKVFISFVVEKDGSVSHVKIERGVSYSIDREAKRLVTSFPLWKPGEDKFRPVRTRVRLPIGFELAP